MAPLKKKPDLDAIVDEFKLILALEEEAARTYYQLASDCDDDIAKKMLFELARQERSHVKIARKLVRLVTKWRAKCHSSL